MRCSRLLAAKPMLLGSKGAFSTTRIFDASAPKRSPSVHGAKTKVALNESEDTTFANLVKEEKSVLWLTKEELEGIPKRSLDLLQEGKGGQTFGISYKHFPPYQLLARVKNAEVRKRICVWNENRLADLVEKHKILIKDRVRTATEKKRLNYFSYKSTTETAEGKGQARIMDTEEVRALLERLRIKAHPYFHNLEDVLRRSKGHHESITDTDEDIQLADVAYYNTLNEDKSLGADNSEFQEYFPMRETVHKLLNMMGKLFGMLFVEYTPQDHGPPALMKDFHERSPV